MANESGVTLANATMGPIILNVTRPGATIVTQATPANVIALPVRGKPVKVSGEDYAFLKKLDVFNRMVDAGAVVVGGKVVHEIRAVSEPEIPDYMKEQNKVGSETQGPGGINATVTKLDKELVTV